MPPKRMRESSNAGLRQPTPETQEEGVTVSRTTTQQNPMSGQERAESLASVSTGSSSSLEIKELPSSPSSPKIMRLTVVQTNETDASPASSSGTTLKKEGGHLDGNFQPRVHHSLAWLLRQARRCQMCQRSYPIHHEAWKCFNSHKWPFRCYLCFEIFPEMSPLLNHVAKRHSKDGIEANCEFCSFSCPLLAMNGHVWVDHVARAELAEGLKDDSKRKPTFASGSPAKVPACSKSVGSILVASAQKKSVVTKSMDIKKATDKEQTPKKK